MERDWLRPEWPAPANVRALSTSRMGGVSRGAYASLNLGAHVGDLPVSVAANRAKLQLSLGTARPRWLSQVHGTRVMALDGMPVQEPADAALAAMPNEACVVMTADCLPVIFCDKAGTRVAAAHAGWRGLSAGVLEATVKAMDIPSSDLMAWFGPAIGPEAYEVGEEVRAAFVQQSAKAAAAFKPGKAVGKWWCDLYLLARQRLEAAGLKSIHGGGFCTYTERDRFFSFRRDGECGRMATLIWLE
jgi:YfiH family protein